MAHQESIIRLSGTIDNLTFYKTKDGYLARKKGGPTREKFKKDPQFERSRENSAEFGNCGAFAGKVRRLIILATSKRDKTMHNRLMKLAYSLLREDKVSRRGQRSPETGLATPAGQRLVEGFEVEGHSLLQILAGAGLIHIQESVRPQDALKVTETEAAPTTNGLLHNRPAKTFENRLVVCELEKYPLLRKRRVVIVNASPPGSDKKP